jgi:hypothetical protein
LGVTQFGDRADIFDKYNQYIEKRLTKNVKFARITRTGSSSRPTASPYLHSPPPVTTRTFSPASGRASQTPRSRAF